MADPEIMLQEWLDTDETLTPVHASLSIPDPRPKRFITVERVGGETTGVIGTPLFEIQCWGTDRNTARDLARSVEQSLRIFAQETSTVGSIDIQSTVNQPDPVSGQGRYVITCQLHVILI